MRVSAPTALQMIRRLRTLGFVEPNRLALTREGTSAAMLIASRRRAAHVLTHDVLGLNDQDAGPAAERLAPNMSATLTRRLLAKRTKPS
jgi:Mn-dependent DtxR family transcriptional regulator